jgi:hypothetical protein
MLLHLTTVVKTEWDVWITNTYYNWGYSKEYQLPIDAKRDADEGWGDGILVRKPGTRCSSGEEMTWWIIFRYITHYAGIFAILIPTIETFNFNSLPYEQEVLQVWVQPTKPHYHQQSIELPLSRQRHNIILIILLRSWLAPKNVLYSVQCPLPASSLTFWN